MAHLPIRSDQPGPSRPGSLQRSASRKPPEAPDGASPAFQALLEKLQKSAQELERTAGSVADATHLAGAVDRARESLTDALSLSDQLLEAYRAAEQRVPDAEAKDGEL